MKISLLFLILLSFFGLLVGNVYARGGIYEIEPNREITEIVRLSVSDEVFGNFSVIEGTVDFLVTSPKGVIILDYTKVARCLFNFSALENGNYTIYLVNSFSEATVTVRLFYSVHYKVILEQTVKIESAVDVGSTVMIVSWIEILIETLKLVVQHMVELLLSVCALARLIRNVVD